MLLLLRRRRPLPLRPLLLRLTQWRGVCPVVKHPGVTINHVRLAVCGIRVALAMLLVDHAGAPSVPYQVPPPMLLPALLLPPVLLLRTGPPSVHIMLLLLLPPMLDVAVTRGLRNDVVPSVYPVARIIPVAVV